MNRRGHVDFGAPSGGITTSDIHRRLGMHRKTCQGRGGGETKERQGGRGHRQKEPKHGTTGKHSVLMEEGEHGSHTDQ